MAPKVLNEELYYALKNRIHHFNLRYGDRLRARHGESGLLTEDFFNKLGSRWEYIAQATLDDNNATNLDNDVVISEDNFNYLKEGADDLIQRMSEVAWEEHLGDTYIDKSGIEHTEYTYVAHDIFEICMLAMYTYTNFFQQCEYMGRNYWERSLGPNRAKEMAKVLYPGEKYLHVLEVDSKTRDLMETPLNNPRLEIDKKLYVKDDYKTAYGDSNDRPSYYDIMQKREENRIKREKIEEEKRREQIRQQEEKAKSADDGDDDQAQGEVDELEMYNRYKHEFRVSSNWIPPSESMEHFYAYFNTLGIDENDLTAQTLIDAMRDVHRDTKDNNDLADFCNQVTPIYRQLQIIAFETSARRCVENGEEIDFNRLTRKLDEIMGALYYTVNPEGFKKGDQTVRMRAAALVNGDYKNYNDDFGREIRNNVIKYTKNYFKDKGASTFNSDAENIFASYKSQRRSSSSIVAEIKRTASEYDQYKFAVQNNNTADGEFEQAIARKSVMDNAYALEKRIETRYASRWSRFIRMYSYRTQRNALEKIKESLGIDKNTRVADVYLNDNIERFVKDFTDIEHVKDNRIHYNGKTETTILDHVKAQLQTQLRGKPLPEVVLVDPDGKLKEAELEREVKGLDPVGGLKTEIGQYNEEQERIKKEEEERKAREENERLEREKEERRLREEEERRIREEKEEQERIEQLVREEKERLYNEKLDGLDERINKMTDTYNALDREEKINKTHLQKKLNEIPGKIQALDFEKADIPGDITVLKEQAADLMRQMFEKISSLEYDEKDLQEAHKEAKKAVGKNVSETDIKNNKKLGEYLEKDPVVNLLQENLRDLENQIKIKQERLPVIERELYKLWKEKDRLQKEIDNPSETLKTTDLELRKLRREREEMVANKDHIIETGEGLGFNREMFLEGDNYKVRESIMRPTYYVNDGRFTVILDDEESNEPIEPRVEDKEKSVQNSKIK